VADTTPDLWAGAAQGDAYIASSDSHASQGMMGERGTDQVLDEAHWELSA
jgi:hypothetical protein